MCRDGMKMRTEIGISVDRATQGGLEGLDDEVTSEDKGWKIGAEQMVRIKVWIND